jgi:hypothetical protein
VEEPAISSERDDSSEHGRSLWPWLLLAGLLAIAVLRIADTYRVFNQTMDEPAHIGAGMQYLDGGTYTYELKHPPMRAVFAVGPWLLGHRYAANPDSYSEGNHILYEGGDYVRTLTAARVAALPFFAATLILIFLWGRALNGSLAGLFAALLYSTLPLALAHAGLATNDVLVTATFTATLFAWSKLLERPTRLRLVLVGIAIALAFLSKMSAVSFIGAVVVATAIFWYLRGRQLAKSGLPTMRNAAAGAALTGAVCLVLIWAAYRFSFGAVSGFVPIHAAIDGSVPDGLLRNFLTAIADTPIPAPEFAAGFLQLLRHDSLGQPAFFLGSIRTHGDLAFFPVAMLIKTPIPFLLLYAIGAPVLARRWWRSNEALALVPPAGALVVLAVCMGSAINIGLRHLLPAFPLLAICAGVGASRLWARKARIARVLVIALLGWQLLTGIRAHPDYLAYFNECCDSHPERWIIDSDLDWGQDLDRLAAALRARHVGELYLAYFGSADPARHGLPPFRPLPHGQPVHGWVAISEWEYAFGTSAPPHDYYSWLRGHRPVARVGKSIRLYRIE